MRDAQGIGRVHGVTTVWGLTPVPRTREGRRGTIVVSHLLTPRASRFTLLEGGHDIEVGRVAIGLSVAGTSSWDYS